MTALRDVVVAGVGMTAFGKFLDRGIKSLVAESTREAIADAGMTDPAKEIDGIFYGNSGSGALQNQHAVRGQHAMRDAGLNGIPLTNVENACASGSTALHHAWLAVASGYADVALAVGADKLHHEQKWLSMLLMGSAIDQDRVDEVLAELGAKPGDHSAFMDIYAQHARAYMRDHGATAEDFARICVKSHDNGALNPKAQYRERVTVEEVLASRPIAEPLTKLMCSPIGDGSAAAIVTTPEVASRWGAQPVRLLAVEIGASRPGVYGELVPSVARRAYERAGVGPEDVDVVECHDATSPAELFALEDLGLAEPGVGLRLLRAGETALGGSIPVNPSGGLVSKGHPVGATGIAQIVELADQLRGRCGQRQVAGARVGVAENAGGYMGPDAAVATVSILTA